MDFLILDSSAIMAVLVEEPERGLVVELTKDKIIASPNVVPFEIANALTKMMKKKVIDKDRMINAYLYFKRIPIKLIDANIESALRIAWDFNIYAYDAFYLELAKRLELPLVTFDGKMLQVAKDLGIITLGGKNASV